MSSISLSDSKLKCPECDKVFFPTVSTSAKEKLQKHIKAMHMQEYKCSECGDIFPTYGKRQFHFDKVHKQMLFNCSVCDSSFACKETLNRHIDKVHTPASCTICDMKTSKWNLKIHMETMHQLYKCLDCEEVFVTSGKRTHHNNVVHKKLHFKCSKSESARG